MKYICFCFCSEYPVSILPAHLQLNNIYFKETYSQKGTIKNYKLHGAIRQIRCPSKYVCFKSPLSQLLLSKKNVHRNLLYYGFSSWAFWNYETEIRYFKKMLGCWKNFWRINLISKIDFYWNKYRISSVYMQILYSFVSRRNT